MTVVDRFVTYVDLSDAVTGPRRMSVSARFEAVLADGRNLTLLDDRGWTSSLHGDGGDQPADVRAWTSIEDIETTARSVVGPDEPTDGRTHEETAIGHWAFLADALGRQGVEVDARELEGLPHDVVLGERLRAWITRGAHR